MYIVMCANEFILPFVSTCVFVEFKQKLHHSCKQFVCIAIHHKNKPRFLDMFQAKYKSKPHPLCRQCHLFTVPPQKHILVIHRGILLSLKAKRSIKLDNSYCMAVCLSVCMCVYVCGVGC